MNIISTDAVVSHFNDVISCTRCDQVTSKKLLRDAAENIAQPGWVGSNYSEHRVLLVGQNPGIPPSHMQAADAVYTAALRRLAGAGGEKEYQHLYKVLQQFVPEWPVQRKYFPLAESGLGLEDIAYCNIVRCRTVGNAIPGAAVITNCMNHFDAFVKVLSPKVVVFIGKWAHDQAAERLGDIPYAFMNRMRSLSGQERRANRNEVVASVRSIMGEKA